MTAITIESTQREDGTRRTTRYDIDMAKCIFCGFCEDACPTEAIVLEQQYELSFYDRASAIYTKDMLIVDVPVNGKSTPQQVAPGDFNRAIPDMKDPR